QRLPEGSAERNCALAEVVEQAIAARENVSDARKKRQLARRRGLRLGVSRAETRSSATNPIAKKVVSVELGQLLKDLRVSRAHTEAEIARQIGCSSKKIVQVEAGELRISVREFQRLIECLNLEITEHGKLMELLRKACLVVPPPAGGGGAPAR
ncbi:MAG: helix-turn-helix transcriptional regulator, partial [Candidatus Melainabacteria bacterium]|nr:helix-turn-helix transcriptional regulator [Candidatus Melainabacteria bacterium]